MIQAKTYRKLMGAVLLASSMFFSACSPQSDKESQDKKSIVVTSYPEYDWLRQIIGNDSDQFKVKLLMDGGVDLHSYEPNIQDIAAISEADLFIYNGGSSYKWVDRVLKLKSKEGRKQINLMDALGNKVLVVEGEACSHCQDEACEHEHDHDTCEHHDHDTCEHHDHDTCEHHDHDTCEHHDHEQVHMHEDEHIWLSLRNAIQLCEVIQQAVSELTPEQTEQLEANKQAYIAKLKELDTRYADTISKAQRDTVIIADRFPFIYLFSDYGLKHHAAFQGCSSETEASFETVTQLSNIVKELKPHVILTVKGGMTKLAHTLINNSGQSDCKTLELNDLHTASEQSYIEVMEENLQVLEAALAP